jgi:6-phosphogluconolactonase
MKVEIVETSLLPRHAAARLAAQLREAVESRGVASLALSGGGGLGPMFTALTELRLPWERIHVFQVDERIAPDGHEDRNWTAASTQFLARLPRPPAGAHPMPVADILGDDDAVEEAVDRYLDVLEEVAGHPLVLDVVHLGLGADGHTASLIPDDPVLEVEHRDLAVTGPYQGRRRMTLTYPALARARDLMWLVSGAAKAEAVGQLVRGDRSIPAGRVRQDTATLLVDPDAAAALR